MKKILKFLKNNFLGFTIGVILCSSIGIIAATIQSSSVSYTTNKNSSITNVKQAVDDLYSKVDRIAQIKYWNANFDNLEYGLFGNGLYPTVSYDTRDQLISNYGSSNFSDNPIYIKSAYLSGFGDNDTIDNVCVYLNNKEFCLDSFYANGGTGVKAYAYNEIISVLKNDIEQKLGVNDVYCPTRFSAAYETTCFFNNMKLGCSVMYNANNWYAYAQCFSLNSMAPVNVTNPYSGTSCASNCDTNGDGLPDQNISINYKHVCTLYADNRSRNANCK